MSSTREFGNPYSGYSEVLDDHENLRMFYSDMRSKIKVWVEEKLNIIKDIPPSDRDYSVYTGSTGIVYLLYHLAIGINKGTKKEAEYLTLAYSLVKSSMNILSVKRITFLCGDAGPLCLEAVIASRKGDLTTVERNTENLVSMADRCCNDENLPNELLYGRAGYLFALLYLQKYIDAGVIDDGIILKVCDAILDEGTKLARKDHSNIPLKFTWHGKEYIGAAHGYVGIFYLLLQPQLQKHKLIQDALPVIKQCIDELIELQFPSGNFPSSLGNSNEKLIQWCHGAPGAVYLFSRAYQVYNEERYLNIARECCNVIWQRGLLQKGYGLCHGTAGNAYAFLYLYQVTKEDMYLYYAYKFGEWCLDYGRHGCRTPDRPFSLLEGLAGTIHFMADLLDPEKAHFPAFQL